MNEPHFSPLEHGSN